MSKLVNDIGKYAEMAELLRDCVTDLDCDIAKGYWKGVVERIDAELSVMLSDHVSGAEEMAPVGVGVVDAGEVLSLCDAIIHGRAAHQGLIYTKASGLRLKAEAAMLAAAPKPEEHQ